MTEQNKMECKSGLDWSRCDSFKLFEAVTSAQSIGKLSVAFVGLVLVFLAGWAMDMLSLSMGTDNRVYSLADSRNLNNNLSEIDIYAGEGNRSLDAVNGIRDGLIQSNRKQMLDVLSRKPFEISGDKARLAIDNGSIPVLIAKHKATISGAVELLAVRYQKQADSLSKKMAESSQQTAVLDTLHAEMTLLQNTYGNLVRSVTGCVSASREEFQKWTDLLVRFDIEAQNKAQEKEAYDKHKNIMSEAWAIGKAKYLTGQLKGKGVFASWIDFKLTRIHRLAMALVSLDCAGLRQTSYELLLGMCWLSRFHPVYALFMTIVGLVVWALAGTAICRVTVLQLARGERIGPARSLRFGAAKWFSAFMAPIIPIIIVLVCAGFIWIGSMAFAWIPGLGAIIGALMMFLGILIGLLITFILVTTLFGYSLMLPAIAAEGSGSFDAISRSISYLREKPWWFIWYYVLTAGYGLLCYIFIRFFVFLTLLTVNRISGAAVNLVSSSSRLSYLGKLDAVWPMPTFGNLLPDVDWSALSTSEAVAAAIVWLVIAVVVSYLLAYGISLYFSASSAIYLLLRKKVDTVAMDDVWVEEDIEALIDDGIEYLQDEPLDTRNQSGEGLEKQTPPGSDRSLDDDKPIPLEPDDSQDDKTP